MQKPWPYDHQKPIAQTAQWDDVHYHTPGIRTHQLPVVWRHCVAKYGACMTWNRMNATLKSMYDLVELQGKSPVARACVDKLYGLAQNAWDQTKTVGWVDPDLQVNVGILLFWADQASKETGTRDLLAQTLVDMGQTCIQGDSHRLLVYLWGVLGL